MSARTVKFRDVLWGVATRMGMDPGTSLSPEQAAAIGEYINLAYRLAWVFYPWPDCIEEPEERTLDGKRLEYEQAGETEIGDVLAIYETDPDESVLAPSYAFLVKKWGILVPSATDDQAVWVEYRRPPMLWTTTEWTAAAYAVGDRVYYPTTGHCYTCIATAADTDLPTDTDHWRQEAFPAILAEAVKTGAYAATLVEEGQHSTGSAAAAAMEEILFRETEFLERQNKQTRGFTVGTRIPPG